jgi:hypothetical protein
MVTMQKLLNVLISGNVKPSDSIDRASVTVFPKVMNTANLGLVSRILERENYVVVLEKHSKFLQKFNAIYLLINFC